MVDIYNSSITTPTVDQATAEAARSAQRTEPAAASAPEIPTPPSSSASADSQPEAGTAPAVDTNSATPETDQQEAAPTQTTGPRIVAPAGQPALTAEQVAEAQAYLSQVEGAENTVDLMFLQRPGFRFEILEGEGENQTRRNPYEYAAARGNTAATFMTQNPELASFLSIVCAFFGLSEEREEPSLEQQRQQQIQELEQNARALSTQTVALEDLNAGQTTIANLLMAETVTENGEELTGDERFNRVLEETDRLYDVQGVPAEQRYAIMGQIESQLELLANNTTMDVSAALQAVETQRETYGQAEIDGKQDMTLTAIDNARVRVELAADDNSISLEDREAIANIISIGDLFQTSDELTGGQRSCLSPREQTRMDRQGVSITDLQLAILEEYERLSPEGRESISIKVREPGMFNGDRFVNIDEYLSDRRIYPSDIERIRDAREQSPELPEVVQQQQIAEELALEDSQGVEAAEPMLTATIQEFENARESLGQPSESSPDVQDATLSAAAQELGLSEEAQQQIAAMNLAFMTTGTQGMDTQEVGAAITGMNQSASRDTGAALG